jgi:hypothetical protein
VRRGDPLGGLILDGQHGAPPRTGEGAGAVGRAAGPVGSGPGTSAPATAAGAAGAPDGEQPGVRGGSGPGGNGLAWGASSEAATMHRRCRASGSRVRTEMRGPAGPVVPGRSRSVTERRTKRRRPSAKTTTTNSGPRAQASETSSSRLPCKG